MSTIRRYSAAMWAGPRALGLIARDPVCRSLVVLPWIWGVIVYLALIVAAFWAFAPLQDFLLGENGRNALLSMALGVGLFIVVSLSSLGFVFVLSAVWSIRLIRRVLEMDLGPTATSGVPQRGFVGDAIRTTIVESVKLLVLAPLYLLSFVFVFVPPLLPFGVLLGAWLVGVTFVDTVLDTSGMKLGRRIIIPIEYLVTLTLFGLPFALLSFVPFVVIFLPPIISVAAALIVLDGHLFTPRGMPVIPEGARIPEKIV